MSDKRPIDQDNNGNSNYFNYAPTPPERKSFLKEENLPRQIQDEKPDGEKAAINGEPSQEPSPNGYFSPRQNLPLESGNSEEKFRYESDFSGKVNLNADFKEQEEAQNRDKRFFGFGIASMVLGIISLICCCVTAFSLIMGLLAVAFAITRMKIKPDGFAIAGIITGGIGFLFAVATIILEASGVKVPTPNSLLDGESMGAVLNAILFRIS